MQHVNNSSALRIRRILALLLVFLLLAGVTAAPAQASQTASKGGAGRTESTLIDENHSAQITAGKSGATWKKVGSRIRLQGADGKYLTGFVKYNGKYYYFDAKGNMKTGFITVNGRKWFASYVRGDMGKGQILTGIVYVKGLYYFMNPASTPCPGAVSTGFQKISGRRYYFNKNGHMVTGWFKVGGSTYYASCNKKKKYGALLTGIQKIGKKTYKFDSSGKLLGEVTETAKQTPAKTLADFTVIHQHPELPTGCEVTSLAMVLNYYDFSVDKLDLADNYLPKGPVGSTDFRKAFVGDPRNSWSYGCYAPVIVKTANKYLTAKNSKKKAVDISGRELTTLSVYTNANIPVLVWGTINCKKPFKSVTWTVNGKKLTWIGQEHCMVLLGFKNGMVQVADPHRGKILLYNLNLFRSRYNSLFKQAVLIR